ncbi:hypothetical protein GCM10011504_29290 [Siccirubricoccus deserti]|nr:hypothetical protein GCM10011504_29290 [Siccirubricoccus deserti]
MTMHDAPTAFWFPGLAARHYRLAGSASREDLTWRRCEPSRAYSGLHSCLHAAPLQPIAIERLHTPL